MLDWQIATVQDIRQETPTVKTFMLTLPDGAARYRAGPHYDLRLTAPDGYQAQRSYSVASPPERTGVIDLTVERLDDGEVSTYLHDVVEPGDRIEVRGPIGGYFVWEAAEATMPLLLVAGGSGVVPLMAMLRHRAEAGAKLPTRLLYSARSPDDVIYREELERLAESMAEELKEHGIGVNCHVRHAAESRGPPRRGHQPLGHARVAGRGYRVSDLARRAGPPRRHPPRLRHRLRREIMS